MAPPKTTDAGPSLLLSKWLAIGRALSDRKRLTYADVAILWQLMDRYNAREGAAWPSLNRLAADTRRDRRTVQRSLNRLQECGLVEVVQRGSRARQTSNRYRPNFEAGHAPGHRCDGWDKERDISDKDRDIKGQLGASAPLDLGASMTEARGAGVTDLGAAMPPESIYEPGHKPGEIDGVPTTVVAGSGAAGASLDAPPGRPARSSRQFGDFWAVYPKATGVYEAEGLIADLLSGGVVKLSELIDGARRYRDWVTAQPWGANPKYVKAPASWLRARGWLDDYKLPVPRMSSKATSGPQKATTKASSAVQRPTTRKGASGLTDRYGKRR